MQMMTVAGGDVNKAVGIYFWGKNRYVIFSCETGTQRNMYIYTQPGVYSGIYRRRSQIFSWVYSAAGLKTIFGDLLSVS